MEYATFLRALEHCRFAFLPMLGGARRVLLYGDGDGRFLAKLLAEHSQVTADTVDSSAAMLALARERVRRLGPSAVARVYFHHADALAYVPSYACDLLVTHFFLDCLSEAEISALLLRVRPHLLPGARWLISEFAIPEGQPANWLGRLIITALYRAFHLLTGLRAQRLPDYASLLRQEGFTLRAERSALAGLLRSELWQKQDGNGQATPVASSTSHPLCSS